MALLCSIKNGVATIDSTMAARMGFISAGSTRPWLRVSASSTKPNSPACARYSPVRSATPVLVPVPRASSKMTPVFNSMGTSTKSSTSAQRSMRMCQSSIMPTVMKNSPSSTS